MAVVSMSYAEMNPKTAEQITYDNSESGLEADNVQDAVDELASQNKSLANSEIFVGMVTYNTPITVGAGWYSDALNIASLIPSDRVVLCITLTNLWGEAPASGLIPLPANTTQVRLLNVKDTPITTSTIQVYYLYKKK